jgi:hypothetical protein
MAEVRKSLFISFCGWMALVCAAVVLGVPLFEVTTGVKVPVTVWPGFMFVAFWPFAFVWIVGTLVHRSRISRARIQAEAFAEAAQRTGRRPQGPGSPGAYPLTQTPASSILGLAVPATLPQAERTAHTGSPSPAEPDIYTYSAPGMPMCPKCGQRPVIFYCSTHRSAVCLGCVATHDVPGECVYVPAFRAPEPTAGQPTAPGPTEPPRAAKPGSIFGVG